MAIDSYVKLQTEILDTLNRTDLAADVTQFTPGTIEGAVKRAITKAELRIVRRLRTKEFETSTTLTTIAATETSTVPTDFIMAKALIIQGNPNVVLAQKDLTSLINDHPTTAAGTPTSYATFGTSFYFRPVPDSVKSIKTFYYAKPTALSATNTSNTLLTKYPDLLLYGSLIEVTAHMSDDPRIQIWKGLFDEGISDVINDNTVNRWSGSPIRSSIDARLVQ